MNSTTKALIAAAVAVVISGGLIVWQVKANHAGAVSLSAADMTILAEDQGPGLQTQLADDSKKRKDFADDVKRLLAVSEEARFEGFANDPKVHDQIELTRAIVLGQAYIKQQQKDHPGVSPLQDIKPEELDSYLKQPGKQQQFDQFVKTLQESSGSMANTISDDQKNELKKRWAQVYIAAGRAEQAHLDQDRHVQLQIIMQEAQQLARAYSEKSMAPKIKATDAELDAYLAKHPKLDAAGAKKKAEDILQKLNSGGNFEQLAKENSDDGSKDQGGDLGWFGRGQMVKPFEDAAFALQPGQVSGVVESQFGFHIIRVDERRTQPGPDGKPEEQVKARHILIAKTESTPQTTSDDREKARAVVEQEKEKKLLDEISERSHVSVVEDFPVSKPDMPQMMPGMGAMPPGEQPQPQSQPQAAPSGKDSKAETPAPKKDTGKK